MLKKLFFGMLLMSSLAACKSKTAFNYNQDFVKKEQSLKTDIDKTEENVGHYVAEGKYDSIGVAGERMEKIVDEKLEEIKKQPAPDVKEAENFKSAIIRYFEFIKSMYTGYKVLGRTTSPEARDEQMGKLKEIIDRKTDVTKDIQGAQRKYADANGFKVEGK